MMKVVLYIDSMMRLGGAQRVMANVANSLCRSGCQVHLITDVEADPAIGEYPLEPAIQRVVLKKQQGNAIVRTLRRVVALRRAIVAEKPDVALAFMGPPNLRLLMALLGTKVRRAVSVRNDPWYEYGRGLKRLLARVLFLSADGVVFQTDEASRYFPGSVRKRSRVIANPVHGKFYQQQWTEAETPVLITAGRLQPQKNHRLLIEAFAAVAEEFPSARLRIFGEGELLPELQAAAAAAGVAERVEFPGNVPDIERRYATATAFVLSSDFEGMPNALMEAMAVGVPVISTDCPCGGPHYLIQNNTEGLLVPCGNVRDMADALRRVLGDQETRRRMSIAARARAEQFHEQKIMNSWMEYLQSVSRGQ